MPLKVCVFILVSSVWVVRFQPQQRSIISLYLFSMVWLTAKNLKLQGKISYMIMYYYTQYNITVITTPAAVVLLLYQFFYVNCQLYEGNSHQDRKRAPSLPVIVGQQHMWYVVSNYLTVPIFYRRQELKYGSQTHIQAFKNHISIYN